MASPFVPSDPSAPPSLAIKAAERAQLQQMHSYIATVSPLFEQVITDMLLEQPEDPHAFLMDALAAVPVAERADIRERIAAAEDARKNNYEDSNFRRAKSQPAPSGLVECMLSLMHCASGFQHCSRDVCVLVSLLVCRLPGGGADVDSGVGCRVCEGVRSVHAARAAERGAEPSGVHSIRHLPCARGWSESDPHQSVRKTGRAADCGQWK